MGYSAPATDLTVTTLIATNFKGRAIVPVNIDRSIIDSAGEEFGNRSDPPEVVENFIATDAIEKWTAGN